LRRFSGSIEALAPSALLGLCLALSGSARAAPAAPYVALLPFDDPRPAMVERLVAESLTDSQLRFWPSGQVRKRLSAAGIRLNDPQVAARTAALLRVALVLRERRGGGQLTITLQSAGGDLVGQLRYPMRRGLSLLRATLDEWLPQMVERSRRAARVARVATARPAQPPPPPRPPAPIVYATPPAPVPVATPTEAPPEMGAPMAETDQTLPADHSEGEIPWPAVIDFALGGGTLSHWLNYNDDLFNALGNYTLEAGPLVAGTLAFYPGAIWTRGVFAHIGLIGDFNHTTGLASTFENQNYSTLDDRWTAGLRIRIPISTSEIGVSGRYGEQDFRMGVIPGSNAPPVPNYTYTFVQAGLDARLQLGIVAILADGAYMDVVDDGIAQSSIAANPAYFPHAQVGAVTTGLHLGFRLWDSLELRAGADYQRYFFSFNPEPGDAHVAGGAVDQYLAATLELALVVR
jgi:hypothetical protein